jgi:hypothetical protein
MKDYMGPYPTRLSFSEHAQLVCFATEQQNTGIMIYHVMVINAFNFSQI